MTATLDVKLYQNVLVKLVTFLHLFSLPEQMLMNDPT